MARFVFCVAGLFVAISSMAFAAETGVITIQNKARFTVITPELVRLEYSDSSRFVDQKSLFAVNRGARFTGYKFEQNGAQTTIETTHFKLVYTADGKAFSPANLKIFVNKSSGEVTLWTPGMKNHANLGGTLQSLDNIKGPMKVMDGVLSRDGWTLIDDSKRSVFVTLNDQVWIDHRDTDTGTDWYFFGFGDDYRGALKSLTTIGGAIPLPRKYVLGAWYSRWWPYTSQDYRSIVQEFHDHDFPLDMVVMDMDWHKPNNWTGYSFNRALFPDAEDFIKWLHDHDLHLTLNDHPQGSVGPFEDRYVDFMNAMGVDPSKKLTLPYNAGDQKYLNNVFKFMHTPLEQVGVDFWWLDWLGDVDYPFNNIDWVNEYYYRHSRQAGLRGQGFFRFADWGDHRHPIHFSGDTHVKWPVLKYEIPFTQSSGNAGVFFWSHDIGGFQGHKNGELLARWTQFGAFSAALRLHSTNSRSLDKRPWKYSKKVEDAMRTAFHLRSEFFPYTYSSSYESHVESVPLVRPLYIDYGSNEEAYNNPQEYLYGDSVLVAPITEPTGRFSHTATQDVWLPDGIWYNWFTGEKLQGPTKSQVTVGLDTFPLFVKGGAPLTLQPYTERMASTPLKTVVIRVYQGADGLSQSSKLYEDDGETEDYMKGRYAVTTIMSSRLGLRHTIRVAPQVGQFKGQVTERSYEIQLAGTGPAHQVRVNGQVFPSAYDFGSRMNRVLIPTRDVGEEVTVDIDAD